MCPLAFLFRWLINDKYNIFHPSSGQVATWRRLLRQAWNLSDLMTCIGRCLLCVFGCTLKCVHREIVVANQRWNASDDSKFLLMSRMRPVWPETDTFWLHNKWISHLLCYADDSATHCAAMLTLYKILHFKFTCNFFEITGLRSSRKRILFEYTLWKWRRQV